MKENGNNFPSDSYEAIFDVVLGKASSFSGSGGVTLRRKRVLVDVGDNLVLFAGFFFEGGHLCESALG